MNPRSFKDPIHHALTSIAQSYENVTPEPLSENWSIREERRTLYFSILFFSVSTFLNCTKTFKRDRGEHRTWSMEEQMRPKERELPLSASRHVLKGYCHDISVTIQKPKKASDISPQIVVLFCVTTLKLFAVVCCFDSEGTNLKTLAQCFQVLKLCHGKNRHK